MRALTASLSLGLTACAAVGSDLVQTSEAEQVAAPAPIPPQIRFPDPVFVQRFTDIARRLEGTSHAFAVTFNRDSQYKFVESGFNLTAGSWHNDRDRPGELRLSVRLARADPSGATFQVSRQLTANEIGTVESGTTEVTVAFRQLSGISWTDTRFDTLMNYKPGQGEYYVAIDGRNLSLNSGSMVLPIHDEALANDVTRLLWDARIVADVRPDFQADVEPAATPALPSVTVSDAVLRNKAIDLAARLGARAERIPVAFFGDPNAYNSNKYQDIDPAYGGWGGRNGELTVSTRIASIDDRELTLVVSWTLVPARIGAIERTQRTVVIPLNGIDRVDRAPFAGCSLVRLKPEACSNPLVRQWNPTANLEQLTIQTNGSAHFLETIETTLEGKLYRDRYESTWVSIPFTDGVTLFDVQKLLTELRAMSDFAGQPRKP
jgi:hypothetical protein